MAAYSGSLQRNPGETYILTRETQNFNSDTAPIEFELEKHKIFRPGVKPSSRPTYSSVIFWHQNKQM